MRTLISDEFKNSDGKKIDLRNKEINNEELSEIMTEIKQKYPDLESILLSNNKIDDTGALALSKELLALKKLTFIDLQHNNIDENGVKALLSLKTELPNLKFALHGNIFNDVSELKLNLNKKI